MQELLKKYTEIFIISNFLLISIPTMVACFYSIKNWIYLKKNLKFEKFLLMRLSHSEFEELSKSEEYKKLRKKAEFWIFMTLIVWVVGFLNFVMIAKMTQ